MAIGEWTGAEVQFSSLLVYSLFANQNFTRTPA